MKRILIILVLILVYSCSGTGNVKEGSGEQNVPSEHNHTEENHNETEVHKEGVVELPADKVKSLQLKIGKLPQQNIHTYVEAYGEIGIPPQSRATITPVIGANVKKILVIAGDKVRRGQVLAYISHPDIIQFQMDYLKEYQKLQFLEAEYKRQEKLYNEKISSGKKFQQIKSEYLAQKGIVQGYEKTLREININPMSIVGGKIISNIPVVSPISGNIEEVFIHVGQYVNPGQEMFDILNPKHLHLHLRVFEEDAPKVKEGQKIVFTTKAYPSEEHYGEVHSVGKLLESKHRFVSVHGHIEHINTAKFIPGMYVKARIHTGLKKSYVLPEEAIVMDGDKRIAFIVNKNGEHYEFKPIEIELGHKDGSVYAVKVPSEYINKEFLLSGAYYVFSESQKGEMGEHGH